MIHAHHFEDAHHRSSFVRSRRRVVSYRVVVIARSVSKSKRQNRNACVKPFSMIEIRNLEMKVKRRSATDRADDEKTSQYHNSNITMMVHDAARCICRYLSFHSTLT
jgi:hypothetical protein